jgi:phage FluMu gp28-like protein
LVIEMAKSKSKIENPGLSQAKDRKPAEPQAAIANHKSPITNVVPLLPYQRAWIDDDSKLKIVVKGRQTGYSFAATLRAVLKCLERKMTWIFLSKGERQSKLLMEKVQDHIRAIGVAAEYHEASFLEGTLTKQLETRFSNGSVIYGLPANPDTARGYSGNVTLDEFAFHMDAAKVYASLYPTITRGYSIEVISTPNGTHGKFYELAKAAGLVGARDSGLGVRDSGFGPNSELRTPNSWAGHKVDIYEAVKQGLAKSLGQEDAAFVSALRAGCDDEETWLQEYCCEFLSDAQNYIPMELIMGCVSEQASTNFGFSISDFGLQKRELYLGVDIGRKRDLTIAWLFEKLGDVLWSRHLLAMKGQTFDTQETAICDLIEGGVQNPKSKIQNAVVRRCCVDQSGLGMMLAERLAKRYGSIVEPVQFTAPVKERLAPMVKQAFEDRTVRIPDNREVRADLNAVKRFVTPGGNVRFDAEHTDKGHADRFWALALVLSAASAPAPQFAEQAALVGEPVVRGLMEVAL